MDIPGGFKIPEVGNEPTYRPVEHPCFVFDVLARCPKTALALSNIS